MQDSLDIDMRQKLVDLIEKHPNSYSRFLKMDNSDIGKWVLQEVPQLASSQYSWTTRCYWIVNRLQEFPKCMNQKCNNTLEGKNVKSFKEGFPKHCCPQCAKDSDARKQLYAQNFQKKYGEGVTNPSQLQEVKIQKKETCKRRLGVDNPAKSLEVKLAIRKRCIEKYGVEHPFQSQETIAKIRQSNSSKYGVSFYSQTKEYHDKVKATNLKNFGVEYPNQDPAFRRKAQSRYTLDGKKFDSSIELAFYIWLRDNKIDFEHQPNISFEYTYEDVSRRCMPDFLVEGQLVELKGNHFFQDKDPSKQMVNPYDHSQDGIYEAKHQCMLTNGVKFMSQDDCKVYVKYVKTTYGKDFLRNCKHQT